MRKIIYILPIIMMIIIMCIGFVIVNMSNTKAFSTVDNDREHLDSSIVQELGTDFINFIKDNSVVKINKNSYGKIIIEINGENYEFNGDVVGNLKSLIGY